MNRIENALFLTQRKQKNVSRGQSFTHTKEFYSLIKLTVTKFAHGSCKSKTNIKACHACVKIPTITGALCLCIVVHYKNTLSPLKNQQAVFHFYVCTLHCCDCTPVHLQNMLL